jgi:hypothetical protein
MSLDVDLAVRMARVEREDDAVSGRRLPRGQYGGDRAARLTEDLLEVGLVADVERVDPPLAALARVGGVHPIRVELDGGLVGGDEEGMPPDEERERKEHLPFMGEAGLIKGSSRAHQHPMEGSSVISMPSDGGLISMPPFRVNAKEHREHEAEEHRLGQG